MFVYQQLPTFYASNAFHGRGPLDSQCHLLIAAQLIVTLCDQQVQRVE